MLETGSHPEAIRYLLASVPYRKQLNFTFDGLKSAAIAIERLRNFKLRLETEKFPEGDNEKIGGAHRGSRQAFTDSLDDDLNTAEALAAVFEYVRDANTAMDAGEFRAGNVGARPWNCSRASIPFSMCSADRADRRDSPIPRWNR